MCLDCGIKEIVAGSYVAGQYHTKIDTPVISPGVYFYKLEADSFVSTKELIIKIKMKRGNND
jgi:hypothetical protein